MQHVAIADQVDELHDPQTFITKYVWSQDHKVIAIGTLPELLVSDHPWIQQYFNGPLCRAAMAAVDRHPAKEA